MKIFDQISDATRLHHHQYSEANGLAVFLEMVCDTPGLDKRLFVLHRISAYSDIIHADSSSFVIEPRFSGLTALTSFAQT
jgi:hypothetical protein